MVIEDHIHSQNNVALSTPIIYTVYVKDKNEAVISGIWNKKQEKLQLWQFALVRLAS